MKVIIFDFDGTLLDSYNAHIAAYKEVFTSIGLELKEEELTKRFGKSTKSILSGILPTQFLPEVERLAKKKHELFSKRLHEVKLYPGVKETLKALKKRSISIALASSMNRASLRKILDRFGIKQYFDTVISAKDVKRGKPYPDILLEAAKRLGKKTGECLVIGDSIYDILAARNAGVKVTIVGNNPYQIEEIKKQNVPIVRSIKDILSLLTFKKE
jgi:HAD superfamily hydrolase (TIGR01509 family)